jgi:hypothetical protein
MFKGCIFELTILIGSLCLLNGVQIGCPCPDDTHLVGDRLTGTCVNDENTTMVELASPVTALCSTTTCTDGTTPSCCNEACYDLDSDTSHCGTCLTACADGQTCNAGHCVAAGGGGGGGSGGTTCTIPDSSSTCSGGTPVCEGSPGLTTGSCVSACTHDGDSCSTGPDSNGTCLSGTCNSN